MTSEWKDHVATIAREIAVGKEESPYEYDVRDEQMYMVNQDMISEFCDNSARNISTAKTRLDDMFKQDIDAELRKHWQATQGDK